MKKQLQPSPTSSRKKKQLDDVLPPRSPRTGNIPIRMNRREIRPRSVKTRWRIPWCGNFHPPARKIIGNLSSARRVLVELDLRAR